MYYVESFLFPAVLILLSMAAITGSQVVIMQKYAKYLADSSKKSYGGGYFGNVDYQETTVAGQTTYSYSLTDQNVSGALNALRGVYSEASLMALFMEIPEFFSIVKMIADRVSAGEYYLADKDGNEVTDNKLWNTIRARPNWQVNLVSFIWMAVVFKYCTGNRYVYRYIPQGMKVRHDNIVSLWVLSSQFVNIKMLANRPNLLFTMKPADYIQHYDYSAIGQVMNIMPENIVHQFTCKLGNGTDLTSGKGSSIFRAAEYPLANLAAVYMARGKIYLEGGPRGLIISGKQDAVGSRMPLMPDEREQAEAQLFGKYGFGDGQRLMKLVDQPLDYVKVGSGIDELRPFEETLANTVALAGIAGVPMALIPKSSENKQTNLDVATRDFYYDTIIPEALDVCEMLTMAGLFGEIGLRVMVEFDDVPALQDDNLKESQAFKTNVEAATTLYNQGHITQNQLLDRIGLDEVDGGDDYLAEEHRVRGTAPTNNSAIANNNNQTADNEA